MNVSWRVLALAGGVALGASVAAACTVTTSGGDDDGGPLFSDSGTGGDTGSTNDSGGNTCTGVADAGKGSDCDNCMNTSCCAQLVGCYNDPSGDCQGLRDCLESTVNDDAGDDGGFVQTCLDLYPADASTAIQLYTDWTNCASTNCSSVCPFQ